MRLYLSSFRYGNHPEELLRLLGDGRRTALILNAQDYKTPEDRLTDVAQETERLRAIGLEPTEVDLRHYFNKKETLQETLQQFDLIWVRGGNAFVLRRAFTQSGADIVIPELLRKDALVYGGYSAGIVIMEPNLRGLELVDDPHVVPEDYNKGIIWSGLGLIPYCIAPHYKSDHPESAEIDKVVAYYTDNHVPFIALHDGEVMVITDDQQRVA